MSLLLHGDCLEQMKGLDDNSVDLIFCDLPYGQTSCKWDIIIPWEPFWKEIMRVKKLNTPIFFTTTTKFGVELISNAPKKCFFRYDLVWVKTAPAGFLCAKKMPMRKHEMVYVFYEKLPFYDLSSHKHKFIKETENKRYGKDKVDNKGMIKNRSKTEIQNKYDPPLPVSVVKEPEPEPELVAHNSIYNNKNKTTTPTTKHPVKGETTGQPRYDPPLPVSVVHVSSCAQAEAEPEPQTQETYKGIYSELPKTGQGTDGHSAQYDPPLPTTMLEIKSTRGKHSTEKPVALMEWILKYYSKKEMLS